MPNFLQRFSFKAMGSRCEIQLYCASRVSAKHIGRQLTQEVERLENKYSRFRSDSVVSTINTTPHEGIAIDQETKALFDHALSCYEQSDGLFDITAGGLTRLWDFKAAIAPSADAITNALKNVGLNKLTWQDSKVFMPAGMEIDFGGIVKEYAADTVANLARMLGCKSGLVNLGGDFAVIGPHPTTKTWAIGIVNPEDQSGVMAALDLHSGGLASSGDYARYFVHEGRRYSHILNPHTGWPSSGLRAVSIAHSLCTVAGSMATIAMLKDQHQAITWLQESGVPHVYMTQDGQIGRR
ncbi:MAG: thiamine biosynthesis lipoprotein [Pseudohongiellaceae bacterium]|jgi:thiamine biosynthesis lipoprotein